MTDAQMESFIWDLAAWQIADWNYIHGIKGEIGIPKSVLNLLLIFLFQRKDYLAFHNDTQWGIYVYCIYIYVYVYIYKAILYLKCPNIYSQNHENLRPTIRGL